MQCDRHYVCCNLHPWKMGAAQDEVLGDVPFFSGPQALYMCVSTHQV